ncbi:hypothetical protein K474DRAFT_1555911, partial [Panus rudis PR-1116 ss-1]
YTDCLAHCDITFTNEDSPVVLRIVGYLEHNEECQRSVLKRRPAIPLHPHVIETALRQLRHGAGINAIQSKNMSLYQSRSYKDQFIANGDNVKPNNNYRFLILPRDFSRLHRRHNLDEYGIDVSIRAELNVHAWLDPSSGRHFRPSIHNKVFSYTPRFSPSDRFIICIASPEMKDAAWTYCHKKQLVLDGTFGLCSSRLLLWIAMGIDAKGQGLPVALFLFSAPTGTQATHAGYNTEILTNLLKTWRDWMGERNGEKFEPYVGMTDTDLKERGALVLVWPSILLLLCKFHVRQCWTNRRKSLLPQSKVSHWRATLKQRIFVLEEALLHTVQHSDALALLQAERNECDKLKRCQDPESQSAAEAGFAFLNYMSATWMPLEMWRSWSQFGRERAANRLGVPLSKILTTTNHLESFNGALKRKYI